MGIKIRLKQLNESFGKEATEIVTGTDGEPSDSSILDSSSFPIVAAQIRKAEQYAQFSMDKSPLFSIDEEDKKNYPLYSKFIELLNQK